MRIGLSYTGNESKHNNYVEWLKADEDIEIVMLSAGGRETLENCDALVLSGGLDTHPKFYHGAEEYPSMPEHGFNIPRDEYELSLIRDAEDNNLPVLGICRGLQLINIFYNGTLVQHIEEKEVEHTGNPDKKHEVNIIEGTLLSQIAGKEHLSVNSAHHQTIEKLGKGLEENCRSEDGLIEGIEWAEKIGKPFLLGVQWHPERMITFGLQGTPLSKNIRDRFILETRNNKLKR